MPFIPDLVGQPMSCPRCGQQFVMYDPDVPRPQVIIPPSVPQMPNPGYGVGSPMPRSFGGTRQKRKPQPISLVVQTHNPNHRQLHAPEWFTRSFATVAGGMLAFIIGMFLLCGGLGILGKLMEPSQPRSQYTNVNGERYR